MINFLRKTFYLLFTIEAFSMRNIHQSIKYILMGILFRTRACLSTLNKLFCPFFLFFNQYFWFIQSFYMSHT